MPNFAILRIAKCKMGSVTHLCKHHERLKKEYKSNKDIDPTRTHLNYHLVKPDDMYRPLLLKRIEEVGAKRRKDSIVMQDALIAATPDWINAMPYSEQVEYFNYAFQFMANRYGRENILSAVVHMDEANPHMHVTFVPITPDGRLSSKEIIGGPRGLEKLQDDFHEHMARKYPDLTRGISKRVTKRRHVSPQVYKQAAALYKHYDEICDAIGAIGMVGNAKAKENALELLGKYAPDLAKVQGHLKQTEEYIGNLEYALQDSRRAIEGKNADISKMEQALFAERDRTLELEEKQRMLVNLFNKIPDEVKEKYLVRQRKERERDAR